MFTLKAPKRIASPYLHGLILLGALAAAACDPGDIKQLLEGHGGGSSPPSTGVDGGGGSNNPCAAVLCATGTHCEEQTVQCIKAPCPPQAVCVKNAEGATCGGIAGIACPGVGTCVDDPSDSCDPKSGGADCGGLCRCVQTVACAKGAKFDSSPGVCACVNPTPPPTSCGPVCQIFCEYGNVLDANNCPTCACNPPPPADPCATVRCAAGTHCEATKVECVKAPCPAVAKCVSDAPVVSCGGIAGIACPGGGKCVDDPSDSCDPNKGGADCGGVCQCIQTVACVKGLTFDGSPKVCACVPSVSPPTCGPVCAIYCEFGHVLDAAGCPTCACNPAAAAATCPPEKCTGTAPKSVTYPCADGKTTAGPSCRVNADGACVWAVVTCPV